MPKLFKKVMPLDLWDKERPEGHELKYHNHDLVLANVGPEYQQFLKELKEKNKKLSKLLEAKMREADLPYSTKPGKGIFKFSVRLAPPYMKPYMQSPDELKAKAQAGQRFNPGNDEIILYLHLDDELNFIGGRTATFHISYGAALTYDLTKQDHSGKNNDIELSEAIKTQNLNRISDIIIDRMKTSSTTEQIEYVLDIKTIEDAQKKFNENYLKYIPSQIKYNFAEKMLLKLLAEQIKQNSNLPKKELEQLLSKFVNKFLDISFEAYQKTYQVRNYLKPKLDFGKIDTDKLSAKQVEKYVETQMQAFYQSLIKRAMDEYKRQKFAPRK